jgi:hypothetical protein
MIAVILFCIIMLEELKKKVAAHMKNELEIMLIIGKLDEKDVKEFNKWFKQHLYTVGINKIMKFCQQKKKKEEDI